MALLEKRRGGGVASATCVGEQFAFGDVSRQFRVSVGLCGVGGKKQRGMKKECRGRVCVFSVFGGLVARLILLFVASDYCGAG